MLKLYGFDVSNYYNMLKLALALKGVEYSAEITYPNQSEDFLAISPMGKVPVLETEEGVLAETSVILEYLDECYPDNPLYPQQPFARARVRELVKIIELYLELPARRCHAEAFFGARVDDQTKTEVKRALRLGIKALNRVAVYQPYLAGETISAADVMLLYTLDLASSVAKKLFDLDLLAEAPEAARLMEKLNQLPEAKVIAEQRAAATPAFKAYVAKAMAH